MSKEITRFSTRELRGDSFGFAEILDSTLQDLFRAAAPGAQRELPWKPSSSTLEQVYFHCEQFLKEIVLEDPKGEKQLSASQSAAAKLLSRFLTVLTSCLMAAIEGMSLLDEETQGMEVLSTWIVQQLKSYFEVRFVLCWLTCIL